jgi:transposase
MTYRYVGIDVSKEKLAIALPTLEGKYHRFQLANSEEGFAALLARLPQDACSVMEATGAYHCRLVFFLAKQSQAIAVVNPLSVKHFAHLQLLKTNKADAVLLASYGQVLKAPLWQPPAQHLIELPAGLGCAGRVYQTANSVAQSETGLAMDAPRLKQSPGRY